MHYLRFVAQQAGDEVSWPQCPGLLELEVLAQGREPELLVDGAYQVDHVTPLDMFPQTGHIECVTRLSLGAQSFDANELRFLDRFDILVPVALAVFLFLLGGWLETRAPGLGTNGPQLLIWGFFVSTVVLFHATVTINSLAHVWGKRRYQTRDDSRNNLWLALLTLGEGWHNNHHHYPASTRQGFYWWEIDITFYLLKAMSWVGLVWDLKPVPPRIRDARTRGRG